MSHPAAAALSAGFDDPVFDAQASFRAAMWALARPGRVERLDARLAPPAPLLPEAAALALALCDYETPIWLDAPLAAAPAVGAFLRFHTGAPIVEEPGAARFALIADPRGLNDFTAFPQGSPDYPDASVTLILQVESFGKSDLVLEGPGIKGTAGFGAAPLPVDFVARMAANRALFPRGVDLLLAGAGGVAGLPRSVFVKEG
ncbi:phosphonate C-P lyase system protein PhnH [Ancylobacter amanitiformis]|uniref:Alpha-D-ribose 1-methylphosphonate 5-triphosphate synthase subunit PhnH n=1 Tax=Ancylobacter amanitiformis TaxID=217069 RepID=A0ABU0LM52_9HYPH|nr:phosphonate C-P lyase system protein PhnH [Ancylobacter amanitiformis]MDQ0509730.1 alpha-D-ribose 1-methylphosphonate 5-triphosphate synthase subunit PhnH [Ancylobacter amanitiformis]